ncbi:hypothetical protein OIU85_026873 [Salix viminalis]|uniref:TF-B3 domain-containing protein n=1 Tax=Salix viminalis TaxID=40686 RepID=A0A9Q0YZ20_SALVM|nr:hypothetical protein OIU85_026873 [Salix viminalis]
MEVANKELKRNDIETYKCPIPTVFLQHVDFPAGLHYAYLRFKDSSERLRVIRCNTRQVGHPRPELGAGWHLYVHDYDLRVGDRLVLLAEEDPIIGSQYRIVARRRIIRLFGAEVWGDLPRVHY